MTSTTTWPTRMRLALLCGALLLVTACARAPEGSMTAAAPAETGLDPARVAMAVDQAKALRSAGQRVWCVPFARNATGIEIRGNAETWFRAAPEAGYDRGHTPQIGAVMAFSGGSGLTAGHVAVVSDILSAREVLVDHANWKRNQVSLGMRVVDVSDANDWSQVRVESTPGSLGRVYRLDGFIYQSTTSI